MEQQTQIGLGERKERTSAQEERKERILRLTLRLALAGMGGFLSGGAVLMHTVAPFGFCLAAVLRGGEAAAAFLGGVLGYLFLSDGVGGVKYLAAGLILLVLRWSFALLPRVTGKNFFAPLCLGGALFAVGAAASGGEIYDLILAGVDALCGGGGAWLMRRLVLPLQRGEKLWKLQGTELICGVAAGMILLCGAIPLGFGSFSAGRGAAIFLILLAGYCRGAGGGAVLGGTAGMTVCIGSGALPFLAGGYAFGGILAGLFAPAGRIPSAAAFLLGNGLASVALGGITDGLGTVLYESVIGAVAFIVLPEAAFAEAKAHPKKGAGREETGILPVAFRLQYLSRVFDEISAAVKTVSRKPASQESPDSVVTAAADRVCKQCGGKLFCWDSRYNDTAEVLGKMIPRLRRGEEISEESFPGYFRDRCIRLPGLSKALTEEWQKAAPLQGSPCGERDFFAPSAAMLEELAGRLEEEQGWTDHTTSAGEEVFKARGIEPAFVLRGRNAAEKTVYRVGVEDYSEGERKNEELTVALSGATGIPLELPVVTRCGKGVLLSFHESTPFHAEVGVCQIPHKGQEICGDVCHHFRNDDGKIYLILSDGMGSGRSAAALGAFCCGLLTRLLKGGFSFDFAAEQINAALCHRDREEALSTLDIAELELYRGGLTLYKAGAAPTLLSRKGQLRRISSQSFPVGILGKAVFEKEQVELKGGEMILLASDGFYSACEGEEWIKDALAALSPAISASAAARKLAQEAQTRRNDGHSDDITVSVIRISRSGI
ncbi:MAG: hypothetical protein E7486_00335 [Ruminococcaceae bacterium]|nr:hypothetical protein [Oscillospiraceae bacterium]